MWWCQYWSYVCTVQRTVCRYTDSALQRWVWDKRSSCVKDDRSSRWHIIFVVIISSWDWSELSFPMIWKWIIFFPSLIDLYFMVRWYWKRYTQTFVWLCCAHHLNKYNKLADCEIQWNITQIFTEWMALCVIQFQSTRYYIQCITFCKHMYRIHIALGHEFIRSRLFLLPLSVW